MSPLCVLQIQRFEYPTSIFFSTDAMIIYESICIYKRKGMEGTRDF